MENSIPKFHARGVFSGSPSRKRLLQIITHVQRGSSLIDPSKTKIEGFKISRGKCPHCGECEAYGDLEKGYWIFCPRLNKCGKWTHLYDLFPELRRERIKYYTEKAKPRDRILSKEQKTVNWEAAVEYSQEFRVPSEYEEKLKEALIGIDVSLEWIRRRKKKAPALNEGEKDSEDNYFMSPAIMFTIGKSPDGKPVRAGRLIDPPEGEGKAHTEGSLQGLVFRHPRPNTGNLHIVGGIFDFVSLYLLGYNVVALVAEGRGIDSIGDAITEDEWKKGVVIALDGDEAGIKATKKLRSQIEEKYGKPPKVIFPRALHQKNAPKDWNEALQRGEEFCNRERKKWAAYGVIAFPKDALTISETCLRNDIRLPSFFHWNGGYYYWSKVPTGHVKKPSAKNNDKQQEGEEKEESEAETKVVLCAGGLEGIKVKYNILTREGTDRAFKKRVEATRATNDKEKKLTFTLEDKDIACGASFRKALSKRTSSFWEQGPESEATKKQLASLHSCEGVPNAYEVDTFGTIEEETGARVFPTGAIHEGAWKDANERGEIELTSDEIILYTGAAKGISPDKNSKMLPLDFYFDFLAAYGPINGFLPLGGIISSFCFSEIVGQFEDFPIHLLEGDKQSGKTTLISEHLGPISLRIPDVKTDGTKAGFLQDMRRYHNTFYPLDDFTKDDPRFQSLRTFIRGHNKGGQAVRGRREYGRNSGPYELGLKGGLFLIANESLFDKPEEKQRMLRLYFPKGEKRREAEISEQMKEKYPNAIKASEGLMVLRQRNLFERYAAHYRDVKEQLNEIPYIKSGYLHHRRLLRFIAVDLAGLRLLFDIRAQEGCSGSKEFYQTLEKEIFTSSTYGLEPLLKDNIAYLGSSPANLASLFLHAINQRAEEFTKPGDGEREAGRAIGWKVMGEDGNILAIHLNEAVAFLRADNLIPPVLDIGSLKDQLLRHNAFVGEKKEKFSKKIQTDGRRGGVHTLQFSIKKLDEEDS